MWVTHPLGLGTIQANAYVSNLHYILSSESDCAEINVDRWFRRVSVFHYNFDEMRLA